MNVWLSLVESWVVDFALLTTAVLSAALFMRPMLRDAGSRVMLAWGTWLAIVLSAGLTAMPMWPRYELARFMAQLRAGQPGAPMMVVVSEIDGTAVEPRILVEPLDPAGSLADVVPQFSGTRLVPAKGGQAVAAVPWPRLLVAAWLASGAISVAWILGGFGQAWMLVRRAKCAPQWIADEFSQLAGGAGSLAEVRVSPELSSAVALGTLKPRILLPEGSAVESNAKAIRAALAHEWAHIRHGDLWLLAIERLLLPLLAVHPLFWWLRRSTRLDQELLADAAAAGDKPVDYAEALIAWAKAPPVAGMGLAALAMWERPSNLSRRVQMILANKRPGGSWLWRTCGGLAACAVICGGAGLSTVSVRALGADDEPVVAGGAVEPPAETPAEAKPAGNSPAPQDSPASWRSEMAITLKVALLVLDRGDIVKNTRKQVIEAVERLTGRPMHESPNSSTVAESAGTLTAEIDNDQNGDLALDIQSIMGVKLVSRAKVITLDGQEAHFQASEPGGTISVEKEINGEKARRVDMFTELSHVMRIKPHALGNGSMLNLDVHVSRVQAQLSQWSTEFKTAVSLGRTLVVVSSGPYAILITPVKAEPQVVSQGATSGERDIGFPIGPIVPAPPVRAAPATRPIPVVGPTFAPYPALVPARTPPPANALPPASTLVPAPTAVPVIPALPTTPAAIPPGATIIPPPPRVASHVAPATPAPAGTFAVAPDVDRAGVWIVPINENATEFAEKLRRLREAGIGEMEISTDPRTNSIVITGKAKDAEMVPKLLKELGATFSNKVDTKMAGAARVPPAATPKTTNQTERKLLELDLAEAQVNLEVAKVELESIQEIRKKNSSAISEQDVRKRQLEVDRATIQVKRIEVQLEADKDASEANASPNSRTIPPPPLGR